MQQSFKIRTVPASVPHHGCHLVIGDHLVHCGQRQEVVEDLLRLGSVQRHAGIPHLHALRAEEEG